MTTAARWALRLIAIPFVLSMVAVLSGCGGGDPHDPPDQPTPAVDCHADPKACA